MPWYAKQQIRQGNALAYDVGHLVPESNVTRHGYDTGDLVVWADPGDDPGLTPDDAALNGAFPNAPSRGAQTEPVQPPAAAEEGTRTGAMPAPKASTAAAKTKPTEGATSTSTEG